MQVQEHSTKKLGLRIENSFSLAKQETNFELSNSKLILT